MKASKSIITSAIVLTSLIGGMTTTLAAEVANYTTNGIVEFIPSSDPTDPLDPENPDPTNPVKPIDPTNPGGEPGEGTAGPLSIDFAPGLTFGQNIITSSDQTYFANALELTNGQFRPNYVQVTDNRGDNAGWKLMVKQEKQFENPTATNKVLTGAEIKFDSPKAISSTLNVTAPIVSTFTLNPEGEAVLVMNAAEGTGAGTWLDVFGTAEGEGDQQKNKAITLTVPGSTAKDAASYGTELTWSLLDSPDNI